METNNKYIETRTPFKRGQDDARYGLEYLAGFCSVLEPILKIMAEDEAFNASDEPLPPAVEVEKTRLSDCTACWCNSCANIEQCDVMNVENVEPDEIRPNPCVGCLDGMRGMPLGDDPPCGKFSKYEGLNYG